MNSIGVALTMAFCLQGQVAVDDFDDVKLFTLKNSKGMIVKITNYGAIITSIVVPDRKGKFADVALGFNRLEDYMNSVDRPYFGAIVGRYGNRIAKGKFSLDGVEYKLATNNGENHLHGGIIGFDKVVWDAKSISGDEWCGVEMSYLAKDREEGYPGNLKATVTYKLNDQNELSVDYRATSDKATPVNLTQHTYFNLKGEGNGDILDHELMINADRFTPVDASQIPTGHLAKVQDTPLDFTKSKAIGRDIQSKHEQIEKGNGFDHNFVLNRSNDKSMSLAAQVYEPSSGRVLDVETTEPGVQFYCGNFLDGRLVGKSGKPYLKRGGLCLETQHFPDSPNQLEFPTTILRPGEELHSRTLFRFSTK